MRIPIGINRLMNDTTKDTIVSRTVSIRREEEQKLKQTQQSKMNTGRVETDNRQFNQSVNASNDQYMIDALSKVRQSKVTLPDSLTRYHGTYIYTNK
jgi:hypothetical protein